jgi:hypothetical protein
MEGRAEIGKRDRQRTVWLYARNMFSDANTSPAYASPTPHAQVTLARGLLTLATLLLVLSMAPSRAHAGGLKGFDPLLGIGIAAIPVLAPLVLGPSIHYARVAVREDHAKFGWATTGAASGSIGLLLMGTLADRQDTLHRPRQLWLHAAGGLLGRMTALSYAHAIDPHQPARERYGLSWLLGAPVLSTCYFLSDAVHGNLLRKPFAAYAVAFGTTQVAASSLWLARGTSDHRPLLLGAIGWGGLTAMYGAASLIWRPGTIRRQMMGIHPYGSLGNERTLGLAARGSF